MSEAEGDFRVGVILSKASIYICLLSVGLCLSASCLLYATSTSPFGSMKNIIYSSAAADYVVGSHGRNTNALIVRFEHSSAVRGSGRDQDKAESILPSISTFNMERIIDDYHLQLLFLPQYERYPDHQSR